MPLKIFAPKNHTLTNKALIAAKYNNVEIETTPEFQMGVDNKTPEFLAMNPLGKVPVLQTDEGCIWESNAIARYVARLDYDNTQLFGVDSYEQSLVEQWIDFASSEISLPTRVWIYPIFGYMENNPEAVSKAKGDIRKVLDILNTHLADKTFLVGERVTLADIVVVLTLQHLFTTVLDPGFRKPFVNTTRWFLTCVNQPHFKSVIGELTLCTKMAVAPQAAKEEKPKQEKPKQEKPKQEKAVKKPAEEEDSGAGDEEVVPPKKKNALDLLPPSTMDLDEWKRFYSNNKGNVSMPWFWEHFDKEGWSLWFSNYKYNEELDSPLRAINLIGGMHQRLEKMMKYAFANNLLLQSPGKNHLEINGCYLIRGQEIPDIMKECDDVELYDWVKVEDATDPAVRTKVEEFWNWEGNFDGRTCVDGKTFK